MSDSTLIALVSPNATGTTICTVDGTPYRTDADGLIYAEARHLAELQADGYTPATLTQVPPGDPTALDQGWVSAT